MAEGHHDPAACFHSSLHSAFSQICSSGHSMTRPHQAAQGGRVYKALAGRGEVSSSKRSLQGHQCPCHRLTCEQSLTLPCCYSRSWTLCSLDHLMLQIREICAAS